MNSMYYRRKFRLWGLFLFLGFIFSQNASLAAINNGVFAFYPFNGNANDESGNFLNGNISGDLSFGLDRFGTAGKAAVFNGVNTKITVPNSPSLRLPEGTWSVWIKPAGGTPYPYIIDQDTYGAHQDGHLELYPDNSVSFCIEDDIIGGYTRVRTDAGAAPQDQWTNIVVTWGGEGMKIYINGMLISANGYTKGITSPGDLVVGSNFADYQNPGAPWFNGSIDDIRIFNRALSPAEIQALYSLVAYYPFNGSANDESGNGLNGNISGDLSFGLDRFSTAGKAAIFNGANTKITVPNSPLLRLPEGTWSVWIKPEGGASHPFIIDQDTYGWTQDGHLELHPDNSISLIIEDDIESNYKYLSTAADAALQNQWTNIVVTWGSEGMKLFVNGVLFSVNSYSKGITSPGDLVIGSNFANYQNPGAPWFNGFIDDVGVYNLALSEEEVFELYTKDNIAPPLPPGNTEVDLVDSQSHGLAGAAVKYYDGGWKDFGVTDAAGKAFNNLTKGTYSFRVIYEGASSDKVQNTATNPIIRFQTVLAGVHLTDSTGNSLDIGTVKFYAGSWRDLGITASGWAHKELLPGSYSFRMTYENASQDKVQNISGDPTIVFQTVNATVRLIDSGGAALDTGTVQFYAGAWRSFGTTMGGQTRKELLPGSYSFRMAYENASQDKVQNIGTNPSVTYQTANMTVRLVTSAGAPADTGMVKFYAGAWRDFGTTSNGQVQKELLSVSYSFRMIYRNASQDVAQNVSSNPFLVYQMGNVVSDSGKCVSFYSGSWQAFSSGMELLPGKYSFRFNDGTSDTQYTITKGTTNHIH
jgi:hypothetical protein